MLVFMKYLRVLTLTLMSSEELPELPSDPRLLPMGLVVSDAHTVTQGLHTVILDLVVPVHQYCLIVLHSALEPVQ